MSNNCSTFAPEIGKRRIERLHPVSGTGNVGVRPARNIRMQNTYRKCAEEKNGLPFRFREIVLFNFLKYETYIYSTLGDHL